MTTLFIHVLPVLLVGIIVVLVVGLFFRKEIAAIRRARRLGPALDAFQCQRCGLCCKLTVVTDVAHVRQLEHVSGCSAEDFTTRWPLGRYVLKKGAEGACVFRRGEPDGTYTCSVYPARPEACRRYPVIHFPCGVRGADARCPNL